MNLDKVIVADIEGDGLLDEISKLHVLSVGYQDKEGKWHIKSTNKKEDVFKVLGDENNVVVGHNFIGFDIPALKLLFPDLEVKAFIIDTLPLSYYLYSELRLHGLETWGETFGVPKVEIQPNEWKGPLEGESVEEFNKKMESRCVQDVRININLWTKMLAYLRAIYDNDDSLIINTIKYLNFKAEALQIQQENPVHIDVELAKKNYDFLQNIIQEKTEEIAKIMPKVPVVAKREIPKVMYKKDGSLSAHGEKWFERLKNAGLPLDYEGVVEEVTSYVEPNPSSHDQIKGFLFSKGWKPRIFKDGANGKVPQLRDDDKDLCESIKVLFKDYPELEALDGLSVAEHRAAYLKNFIEMVDENNTIPAWAHAFTRTLRLKHVKPFVNLPKPNSHHGELVRACMVAPEGYVLIGSDLSSIEDKCKQISIYPYDPEYVMTMNTKGWDAHLSLGLKSGMFTQDEVDFYKWYKTKDRDDALGICPESFRGLSEDELKEAFEILDKKRAVAKTVNYASVYGAGAPKIAESGGMTLKEARKSHKAYWDINWSVKKFASDRVVKEVEGQNWVSMGKKKGGLKKVNKTNWIWNEFSKMWLFLKNDKDRFSACNQNFGVKVFDTWGYFMVQEGIRPIYQAHDEYLWLCKEEDVERDIEIFKRSIEKVNRVFNPPIPIEADYEIGKNYAEVH